MHDARPFREISRQIVIAQWHMLDSKIPDGFEIRRTHLSRDHHFYSVLIKIHKIDHSQQSSIPGQTVNCWEEQHRTTTT